MFYWHSRYALIKSQQNSTISTNALEASTAKEKAKKWEDLSSRNFKRRYFFEIARQRKTGLSRIVVSLFYTDKEEFHGIREKREREERRKDPITHVLQLQAREALFFLLHLCRKTIILADAPM